MRRHVLVIMVIKNMYRSYFGRRGLSTAYFTEMSERMNDYYRLTSPLSIILTDMVITL